MRQTWFLMKLPYLLALYACCYNLPHTQSAPYYRYSRPPYKPWVMTEDNWNITDQPRSIVPLLSANRQHAAPPKHDDAADEAFLARLKLLKERGTKHSGRMLWFDNSGSLSDGLVTHTLSLFKLQQVAYEIENSVMSKVSCTACQAGVAFLQQYIRSNRTPAEIMYTIEKFCTNLHIQSPRVCNGITELFGPEVIYVLQNVQLSNEAVCSFVIGDACGDVYVPYHEWEVRFPPVPKPPPQDVPIPLEGAPLFKVLHISDTHYDPYYAEGSNADCKEPLCCRLSSGRAATPHAAAGRWGDYRKCDTPKRTVDSMLQHIAETHSDIDYILWTGDLPPHDVWNQTKAENLQILKDTVKQMLETFPGVPIFPALGNHESAPVNSFPSPVVIKPDKSNSISWLYDELDRQWRNWLPTSTSGTVRRGAFYSVLVRPGFRILSLNMNYCNNKNWWLLLNSTDPGSELEWLLYELQAAELSDEKVHIIGHIPPGHSDCLKVWSRNFYKIVARYESTITAQFYGHTHYDEFEMFYDPDNLEHVTGIGYIGPSVSPYYDLNPGYRIYYVDGDHQHTTRLVVDHESWIMNLKEANQYDYPIWYKLYSARPEYGMVALRPVDWNGLIDEMTHNKELFEMYYKNYYKNSPVRPPCTENTRKRLLCDSKSGRSHDRKHFCQEVESKIDESSSKSWTSWIYRGLSNSRDVVLGMVSDDKTGAEYETIVEEPTVNYNHNK